jgi:hypothetical protein
MRICRSNFSKTEQQHSAGNTDTTAGYEAAKLIDAPGFIDIESRGREPNDRAKLLSEIYQLNRDKQLLPFLNGAETNHECMV